MPPPIEWRPRTHNGVCAFSAAAGESSSLHVSVEHNANWAVAHGLSFTLFRSPMAPAGVHGQWEKVHALQRMLERDGCEWLMHIDADAVVADVTQSPKPILHRLEAEAAPARPALFASCNSPLGRGLDCDVFCCGRVRQLDGHTSRTAHRPRPGCAVGLHDLGVASPYPCMINSGVFFVRVGADARALLGEWRSKQSAHPEVFGEQASLNELKEQHPSLIDVVGGQAFNSHASFHKRFSRTDHGRLGYDIALRVMSGYQPYPHEDSRLNQSSYAAAALRYFGAPLSSEALKERLQEDLGECARDPAAFVCHPFARPTEMKQKLAREVATSRRGRLEQILTAKQQMGYLSLDDAASNLSAPDAWSSQHREHGAAGGRWRHGSPRAGT